MTKLDNSLFTPASFFCVRTAIFPMKIFFSLIETENISDYLLQLFQTRNELREAIAIASPTLYEALIRITTNKEVSFKKREQAISSLFKYILRMTTRTTPFGLFSFVSLGEWSSLSSPEIDLSDVKKRARPSMEWIQEMVNHIISKQPESALTLKSNPLLYETMGRIGVIYPNRKNNGNKSISVNATPLVRLIIEKCKNSIHKTELLDQITMSFPTIHPEKMIAVVDSLIELEILYPTLLPSLLTKSPLLDLLNNIPLHPELQAIESLLCQYNSTLFGEGENIFRVAQEEMKKKLPEVASPIQIDSICDTKVFIPSEIASELSQGIEVLWTISATKKGVPSLRSYHSQFLSKYGTLRAVPLMEVLNETTGLGIPESYLNPTQETDQNTPLEPWLVKECFRCIREKKKEIVLTQDVLQQLIPDQKYEEAPSSFDVYFEISKEQNNFLILLNSVCDFTGGCSGFGRFLDLFDKDVEMKIKSFFQQEETEFDDAIHAEISYSPANPKNANVAIHPNLRSFVINVGHGSCKGTQISLEDILVRATPTHLFLTTKHTNKRLIVSAMNVLGVLSAPHPVRFLREVSRDHFRSFSSFPWGTLSSFPFLPAVRYKNMILTAAQWKLTLSLLGGSEKDTSEILIQKIRIWSEQYNLPRFTLMTWTDHRLLLDTSNDFHLKEIVHRLKSEPQSPIILMEKRGEATYPHQREFVAPFLKNKKYFSPPFSVRNFCTVSSSSRWEIPGDGWFYTKVYMARENETRFLISFLPNFLSKIQSDISHWFFIRYKDENGPHIRLRFKTKHDRKISGLFDQFHTWTKDLMNQGWIKETQLASYEREIERYGGESLIDLAENFFGADSEATIALLHVSSSGQTSLPRHILASLSLLDLLNGFGLNLEKQEILFEKMGLNKASLIGFREWKSKMLEAFSFEPISLNLDRCTTEIFERRREGQSKYAKALEDHPDLDAILQSILHMHCNRLLGTDKALEQKAHVYAQQTIKALRVLQQQATFNP